MYDILVYLFETYLSTDAFPEPAQLAHKLSAAGFERDEISDALDWLSALEPDADAVCPAAARGRSLRLFDAEESARLDTACRGFLQFLENANLVDGATRELIIDRAMAMHDVPITLAKFKVIVLMVLWTLRRPVDSLLIDELLGEEDERQLH